jgi:hypothetical protein
MRVYFSVLFIFNMTAISTVELCFDVWRAARRSAARLANVWRGRKCYCTTRSRRAPTLPRFKCDVSTSLDTGVYHSMLTIVQPSPSMMAGNQSSHSTLVGVPIERDR